MVLPAFGNEKNQSFSILEAGEKGSFNMGPALGDVTNASDELAKKEVLKFDYTIFSGSILGIYTKDFPAELGPKAVDAIRIGTRSPTKEQLRQVSARLEVKGANGMQTIPLRLNTGWSYFREEIDWNRIGALKEVVFVVSPLNNSKRMDGILYFDLYFYKMDFLEKYLMLIRIALVLLASVIIALAAFFANKIFGRKNEAPQPTISRAGSIMDHLKRDLLYGAAAVVILGTAMAIYSMGMVRDRKSVV
jgi:hypothetical protein